MKKNTSKKHVHVAVGVVENKHQDILIAQRSADKHQGGCWEFPGGKIEVGESTYEALSRELHEELDIRITEASAFCTLTHEYSDLIVTLDVWRVGAFEGVARGREGQPVKWIARNKLKQITFPAANRVIVARLCLPRRVAVSEKIEDSAGWEHNLEQNIRLTHERQAELFVLRPHIESAVLDASALTGLVDRASNLCLENNLALQLSSKWDLALAGGGRNCSRDFGLHLSARDLMAAEQRPIDDTQWLGASCHTLEECRHAEAIGCDYVFLSPISHTSTHPDKRALGFDCFEVWANQITLPVYALGGMTEVDLQRVLEIGGQGFAAIGAFSS